MYKRFSDKRLLYALFAEHSDNNLQVDFVNNGYNYRALKSGTP